MNNEEKHLNHGVSFLGFFNTFFIAQRSIYVSQLMSKSNLYMNKDKGHMFDMYIVHVN